MRAGKRAGTDTRKATVALIHAVSDLVDKAVDQVVLGDERVGSAAEARQLLKRNERVEALTGEIQRVVALAVPVLRRLARGARFTRVPWVFVATTTLSIGVAVRSGVKEIQTLSSLVAHRLERATGAQPIRRWSRNLRSTCICIRGARRAWTTTECGSFD